MRHGSLFAGVGGFDLGFERAGIETVWTVENDKSCNQVLATHWPDVERHEDVREVGKHNLKSVDLISGGFPCQDLSVAGRREGLAGERSGLWFEFARIVGEMVPEWVVVENVPGLFSSGGGRDFLVIVRALEQFGYCVAWRVLDSQHFGVPQRRRRVFIIGSLGGTGSIEVLFESESGEGHIAEGKEAWQRITAPIKASSPSSRRGGSNPIAEEFVVEGLSNRGRETGNVVEPVRADCHGALLMVAATVSPKWRKGSGGPSGDEAQNLIAMGMSENQRAEVRLTPYARQLTSGGGKPGQGYPCVAFTGMAQAGAGWAPPSCPTAEDQALPLDSTRAQSVAGQMGVRRLTPTECERLQGFPDGWTKGLSDTQRYKTLGNAVTVNVAEWIGKRIRASLGDV